MLEQFKQRFIEEAIELLNSLERTLLKLEKDIQNQELIREVFRIMHTIKGSAGMYDLKKTVELTHKLESIYAEIRDNKTILTKQILSLTFQSIDFLRELVTIDDENNINSDKLYDFNTKIDEIISGKEVNNEEDDDSIIEFFENDEDDSVIDFFETQNSDNEEVKTYYMVFTPDANVTSRGINLKSILDDIQNYKYHKIITHFLNENTILGSKFYIFWEIFISTEQNINDIQEKMIFVSEECVINQIANVNLLNNNNFIEKIDKLYHENQLLKIDEIIAIINSLNLVNHKISENQPEIINNLNKKLKNKQNSIIENQKAISEQKTSYIKVASEKLDELMNLVSELVTTKAELKLTLENVENERLDEISEKIDKITSNLRNNALNIRLIPIESVLHRFERLVRDLAEELNKEVEFTAEGKDTELDKNIIDNLSVPLMHIIRNAVDHGIEDKHRRKQLNKSERGIIRFIAFYSGTNVFIQVRDDGAGIDLQNIKQKAIEKGFISEIQNLTKKEIFDLIFLPGFSTAQKISGISGRGVGMDVVKKSILDLRGEIEIDSEINLGTSVTIKLPLTLSIVDTLLVTVDDNKLLIPLSNVDSCGQILHSKLVEKVNQRITYNNELIPYIYIREKFLLQTDAPEYESIIFVKYKDKIIALIFDSIVGEHQAVLKTLGDVFIKQEFISGGSILGDGSVALILDTNKLIKNYSDTEF